MTGTAVPILVAIDLEPDDIRSRSELLDVWSGAHEALAWAEQEAHGWPHARIEWFVRADVQTEAVLGANGPFARLRDGLLRRIAAGDEVGVHPHVYRLGRDGWRNDYASPAFALTCLRVAEDARAAALGCRSAAFRWGDRVQHASLHRAAAELGLRFDLTAEPGRPDGAPRDGGAGRTAVVPWELRTPALGTCGVVHWPVTTLRRADLNARPTGLVASSPMGSFDQIDDGWLHGWCADADVPDGLPVDVELLVQGRHVATVSADWLRPDLEAARVAGARHGARVAMDDRWRQLPASAFELRPVGAPSPVRGQPLDLRTSTGFESTIEPLQLIADPQDFERGLRLLVDRESVLTLVVRSDAFTDDVVRRQLDANVATLRGAILAGSVASPLPLRVVAEMLAPLPTVVCH